MTDPSNDAEFEFGLDLLWRPEVSRNPWPYYKQMRDTLPVARSGNSVFISKHEDIDRVLHEPKVFTSRGLGSGPGLIPITMDPPEHSKWRRLLDPFFSPREMNKLKDHVTLRANEHIDRFIDRGECDYADEYGVPFPCSVFMELMGFPLELLDSFVEMKERMLRGGGPNRQAEATAARGTGDDHYSTQSPVQLELGAILEDLLASRSRAPKDDLMTRLLSSEIDGRPLTHEETISVCNLLFIAGLDTVTDTLTCFYAFLAQNDEHRRRLVEEPEVIPRAVEEMLRYESPVTMVLPRRVTEETELSGCPIHTGDVITPLLGSANNDERVVDSPGVVDFDREAVRHLAFGGGVHRCLGSNLARLELRVSLAEWHRRIPEYHIPEGVELKYAPSLRQVEHLPLVFDKVTG